MRKPVTELAYVNMYDKPTITRHSRSVSNDALSDGRTAVKYE